MLFAHKLGLAFGKWNVEKLLDEMPWHQFCWWKAYYQLRPWDAETTKALVEGKYERPAWLEDMIDKHSEREKRLAKKRGGIKRGMTAGEIRRRMKNKGALLSWTWP
ncbi:MAG: hypothetical protein WDA41_10140 [Candidatus Neomarinimicrobiota bacterium]